MGNNTQNLNIIKSSLVNDYRPLSTQILTVTTSALHLTVPDKANFAVIQNQGDDVRYWEGSTPTGTEGILLTDNSILLITNASNLHTFQVIQDSGSSAAKLHIEYFTK